jgi:hypothetical protein
MDRLHLALGGAACMAAGALASQLLLAPAGSVRAADNRVEPGIGYSVVNSSKSGEALVFIYDPDNRRLLMYTTVGGNQLKLSAVRNTYYDAKLHEYNNADEKGTSVRELKKAVEDEEKKEKEKEKKGQPVATGTGGAAPSDPFANPPDPPKAK